ncbi:hypothetical protein ACOMHN_066926 [Nucella lapillus]
MGGSQCSPHRQDGRKPVLTPQTGWEEAGAHPTDRMPVPIVEFKEHEFVSPTRHMPRVSPVIPWEGSQSTAWPANCGVGT